MRQVTRKWIPLVIGSAVGFMALAGYLLPRSAFASYRDLLVKWAVIVAGFALVLGAVNVLRVHGARMARAGDNWGYSVALIVAAALAWIPPLLLGPSHDVTQTMLTYVLSPLGGSLAAVLVFTLTLAGVRLLRRRRSFESVLFILVVAFSLLGTTPLLGVEWLADIRSWLIGVPGMAGFRGLLLGVAIGTLITGLRVLTGSDRPQGDV